MPSIKVKNEELFRYFAHSDCEPTNIGREQFFKEQSLGKSPDSPDPYYLILSHGKRQFDWLTSEYQRMYFLREWWGFLTLWKDWEGNRWILPYLCKWHPNPPEWIDKEITREELLEQYGV